MLVKITSLKIVTEVAFRALYPNTSFPAVLTDAILAPYDHAVLITATPPDYDSWTHRLIEGKPEQHDGKWLQTWTLEEVLHTPEEETERLAREKSVKLAEIKTAFARAETDGFVMSSLGFRADATRRSIEDIDGLIDLVAAGVLTEPVQFRDYDNAYHSLTLAQLSTLRIETKARGPLLYAHKWELEAALDAAQTVDTVQDMDINAGWIGVES